MATDEPSTPRTRRNVLSTLCTGAAGFGLFAGNASARPHAPNRELTAMSYNVYHGTGPDGRLDLEHTAHVIGESGAELVGLQEMDVH